MVAISIILMFVFIVGLIVIFDHMEFQAKKRDANRDKILVELNEAMRKRDVRAIKRIVTLNASEIDAVDKDMRARVDTYVDEIEIDDDNQLHGMGR